MFGSSYCCVMFYILGWASGEREKYCENSVCYAYEDNVVSNFILSQVVSGLSEPSIIVLLWVCCVMGLL